MANIIRGMTAPYHERGFWLDTSDEGHVYDERLCRALAGLFQGQSVIDAGCGQGRYLRELRLSYVDVDGFDGNPYTPPMTGGRAFVHDLTTSVDPSWRRDNVLCLEVAEHIPRPFETQVLDHLTQMAAFRLVLSWAQPEHDGRGHVNGRTNEEVIELLEARRWRYNDHERKTLCQACAVDYFQQNLMVFGGNL